ncbi:MAG TPA: hypothetical protein DCQ13_02345, partial [Firmicutes bacterium]|nr:hypothetical protein [Bacillota bacterium]
SALAKLRHAPTFSQRLLYQTFAAQATGRKSPIMNPGGAWRPALQEKRQPGRAITLAGVVLRCN